MLFNFFFLISILTGIKAATPSAFNTPCGVNSFTPTATPCNSPDGSPRCQSPEPFSIPQLILSSVPQFIKDTVGGGAKKKVFKGKRANPEKQEVNTDKRDLAALFFMDLIFNSNFES